MYDCIVEKLNNYLTVLLIDQLTICSLLIKTQSCKRKQESFQADNYKQVPDGWHCSKYLLYCVCRKYY